MEPQKRPVKQILIFLAVFVPCTLVWLIICGIGAMATATGGSILRNSMGKTSPLWGIAAFGVPFVVLMVGSLRVVIPLIRNPPRPSAGIRRLMIILSGAAVVVPVGVFGFFVVRHEQRVAPERRLPTADEFRARWVGAPIDELVAVVGPTRNMQQAAARARYEWFDKMIARNPENNRAYRYVSVQVSPDGRVIDVVFW